MQNWSTTPVHVSQHCDQIFKKKLFSEGILPSTYIPFVITIALFLVRNINVFKVHNITVCIPFVFLVLVVSDMSVSNNIPGSFNTFCTSYKQVFL